MVAHVHKVLVFSISKYSISRIPPFHYYSMYPTREISHLIVKLYVFFFYLINSPLDIKKKYVLHSKLYVYSTFSLSWCPPSLNAALLALTCWLSTSINWVIRSYKILSGIDHVNRVIYLNQISM